MKPRPAACIVCLCGSTRFKEQFRENNLQETLKGRIVLSIGCESRSDAELFGPLTQEAWEGVKRRLDALHLEKIELADRVLVLNVGGYIGESTRAEIEHAARLGKPIDYLEPLP